MFVVVDRKKKGKEKKKKKNAFIAHGIAYIFPNFSVDNLQRSSQVNSREDPHKLVWQSKNRPVYT